MKTHRPTSKKSLPSSRMNLLESYRADPHQVQGWILELPSEKSHSPQVTLSNSLLNTYVLLMFTHVIWLFAFLYYVEKIKEAEEVSLSLRRRLQDLQEETQRLQECAKAQSAILQEFTNHNEGTDQGISAIWTNLDKWRVHNDKAISQLKKALLAPPPIPLTPARLVTFDILDVLNKHLGKSMVGKMNTTVKYILLPEHTPKDSNVPPLEWKNFDASDRLSDLNYRDNTFSLLVPAGVKCYLKTVWINPNQSGVANDYYTSAFAHFFDQ